MPKDFRATMLERAIGRTICAWRDQRGFSLAEASQRVGFSSAKLSMMENAVQPSAPLDVMALGHAYRIPVAEWQEQVRKAEWARRLRLPAVDDDAEFDAAADFADLAREVTWMRVFHNGVLPRVFQLEGQLWSDRLVGRNPLVVDAVLTEAVVRQVVGGPAAMKAQLLHLVELGDLPTVTIQIVPGELGGYPAMGRPFTLLSFPHKSHDDVVYVEHFAGARYLEDRCACETAMVAWPSMICGARH